MIISILLPFHERNAWGEQSLGFADLSLAGSCTANGRIRVVYSSCWVTAIGRYVALHITAIMCTVELCALRFCEAVHMAWLLALRVGRR